MNVEWEDKNPHIMVSVRQLMAMLNLEHYGA